MVAAPLRIFEKQENKEKFRPSHVKTLLCWRKKNGGVHNRSLTKKRKIMVRQANKPPKEILSRVKMTISGTWQGKAKNNKTTLKQKQKDQFGNVQVQYEFLFQ